MKPVPLLYDTDIEATAFDHDNHNRLPVISTW
jgi:hypothetical protein